MFLENGFEIVLLIQVDINIVLKINYSHWYQPLLSIHLSDVPKVCNGVIGFNNLIIAAMIWISFILTAGTSENE